MNQNWRPEPSFCPYCNRSFKWQSSMAKHINLQHQQQQSQRNPNVPQQNLQQQQQNQRLPIWRQQEGKGQQQNVLLLDEGNEQQLAQQNQQPIVKNQGEQQIALAKIVQKKEKPQKKPKCKGKVGRPKNNFRQTPAAKNNMKHQQQIDKANQQKIAREMRLKRINERRGGFGEQIGQQNVKQQQNQPGFKIGQQIGPQHQMQQNEAGPQQIDQQIGKQHQKHAHGLEQEMMENDEHEERTNRRIKQEPAPMEEDGDVAAAINAQHQQQPEQQFPLLHSNTASIVDENGEQRDLQPAAAEEELIILEQVEQVEMKPDLVLAASNGLNSASQQFMLHAIEACSTGHILNFSFDTRCRLIGIKAEFKCTKCAGQQGQIRCAKNFVFCRACCLHPVCRPADD